MKSIIVVSALVSIAFLTGCGSEYPLTTSSSPDSTGGANSTDTFMWSGEKKLSASQKIPVGATYWCAPGTQLLLPDNATISVKGSLILSGTADLPVRIICPSTATISVGGKVSATHLSSSGNGGTLFTGSGGSCVLDNSEINGYAIAIGGYLASLGLRNATFQDNGTAVSLAPVYDVYTSNSSLLDLKFSGVTITGSGRQTGIGLSLNNVIAANSNVLLQQTLFGNLKTAVAYTVPASNVHFTAVNVTVKNCTDGFAPHDGYSSAFDTMIVSNSDISTQNPAIALDSLQGVNLLVVEYTNVHSQSGLPLEIRQKARTKVQFNQVALIDRSGIALSPMQVNDVVANSANITRLVLDPEAVSGRGMGYDYVAAKPETSTTMAPTVPTIPVITGAVVGDDSVTLTWAQVAGDSIKYNVYFSTGNTLDLTDARIIPNVTSPKTVNGLSKGKNYTFAVNAYNNVGKSQLSVPVIAKPLAKPARPMITTATTESGAVTITWDTIAFADSYTLYYRLGSTVDKLSAKFTNVTSPKTVTGLTNQVQYAFAVSAVNSMGESDLSDLDTLVPSAPLTTPLISAASASDGSITLAWGPVPGALSYTVYYAADTIVTKNDAKIANAVSPKAVSGLSNGTHYAFAVSAVNGQSESPLSAVSKVTPIASPIMPVSPANAAAIAGNGGVTISWNPVAGATSYNVYYAADTTATKNDARIANAVSPKTIIGLSNGMHYAFAISAVNGPNESALSDVLKATPMPPPVVPSAPTSVTATSAGGSVTVNWGAVEGAQSYKIYYTAGTTVDKTGSALVNAVSPKSVQGLSNGTVYAFAVCAVNAVGESNLSAIVTATPLIIPGIPVISTVSPADSSVTLSWNAVALATSYNLYYALGSTVDRTGLKIVSVSSPFTLRALTNGTTYAFSLTASNLSGESGISVVRTATPGLPPPSSPTNVFAVAGQEAVTVQWSPVNGATSYNIYYTQGPVVDKTGTKAANATSPKIIVQLTAGVEWAFCVTAVNGGGESPVSDVATATPTAKN
jgi:hypothetical protein